MLWTSTTAPVPRSDVSHQQLILSLSADDDFNGLNGVNGNEKEMFPGLSRQEIEEWMETVPVYTITKKHEGGTAAGSEEDGGAILLEGPNGEKVSYCFLTQQMADMTMSQLREASVLEGGMEVSKVNFGNLWFDLIAKQQQQQQQSPPGGDDVEYRLVPDPRDLQGARTIQSDSIAQGNSDSKDVSVGFQSTFNEIPVFMDFQTRFEEEVDGNRIERFPMYLGLQDLVQTCQRFMETTQDENYEAAINVVDLQNLIVQMQQESTVDYRNAVLIPPTQQIEVN